MKDKEGEAGHVSGHNSEVQHSGPAGGIEASMGS